MAARALSRIPGISVGTALVLIANVSALAAMAALWVLVRHDFGDSDLARRSVWLLALAPSGLCAGFAYADGALLLCAVVTFLGARTGRWWWAAMAGWRSRTGPPGRHPVGASGGHRGLANPSGPSLPPLLGRSAGCGCWLRRSEPPAISGGSSPSSATLWLPLRIQVRKRAPGHHLSSLRRHAATTSARCSTATTWGAPSTCPGWWSAWHWPSWPFGGCRFRTPCSAVAVLAVSLSSSNLDSFERYALGAFPLIVAASTLTRRRTVERAVLILSAAGMVGYACLAFLGVVVPWQTVPPSAEAPESQPGDGTPVHRGSEPSSCPAFRGPLDAVTR